MSETRKNFVRGIASYQKRMLDMQRSLFENTFNAMRVAQQQQQDFIDRLLGGTPNLPAEAHDVVRAWRDAAEENRRFYRQAMDRSFLELESYIERLTESSEADTAETRTKEAASKAGVNRKKTGGSAKKKAKAKKKVAKKAPARKKVAKKASARKKVAKKASARKKVAKKAPARKKVAKKAPARKKVAKKASKRSPARRS